MRTKRLKLAITSFLLVILCIFMSDIPQKNRVFADSSSSEIVMDVRTNRVLYEKNANDRKYMASTTKILTCMCAIENCDINEIIKITKDTTGIEGSSIYLEEGEELTIKDLLYGLMLRSGNDCAEAIAKHVSGSIEKFAELMNKTAKRIGANNSNFTNPHGLHDDNHYTTAYDLALISCYSMKNRIFKEICSTKKTVIPFTTKNTKRVLLNKNKLLKSLDGATGVKTGFTKKAGRCLVSSCERNGNEIVCVVLNCPPMFELSTKLINDAFSKYEFIKIFKANKILKFLNVKDAKEKVGIEIKNDIIIPISMDELKTLNYTFDCPKIITNNISKDKSIGNISISIKNSLIFSEKIYTIIDVKNFKD